MLLSMIPDYFKVRRSKLMTSHPVSAFIFPSNRELIRNHDVGFPFRQESNFFYLSGFDEPDSFLVITPGAPGGSQSQQTHRTILFVRPRDKKQEMWAGEYYGVERAMQVFGADEAYPISELEKKLPELLKTAEKLYYRIGRDEVMDRKLIASLESLRRSQGRSGRGLLPIFDPNEPLGEMRIFKGPEELALLRKACQITAKAHKTVIANVRPGMNEGQVEASINYEFRRQGCQRVGYESIVAGGQNATCLHYRQNNGLLRDGELLLIDAAGEFDYYTSDITRTFPIGRHFTPAQAKVYDLVLRAQLEGIAAAKPGSTLPAIHKRVCEVLTDGLISLGLLKGKQEELASGTSGDGIRRFYPHQTSHWLGMDVHDLGLYRSDASGEARPLAAGMVLTIEPGFYVQPDDQDVPPEYRNIGIRIEDDILITENGCEVLTSEAPKTREDIEALKK